jgi:hypothetical protein
MLASELGRTPDKLLLFNFLVATREVVRKKIDDPVAENTVAER